MKAFKLRRWRKVMKMRDLTHIERMSALTHVERIDLNLWKFGSPTGRWADIEVHPLGCSGDAVASVLIPPKTFRSIVESAMKAVAVVHDDHRVVIAEPWILSEAISNESI